MKGKKGQVWIETTIYTLIALVMIGLVLGFARPKIQAIQDEATIESTIEILKTIDNQINSAAQGGVGNKRIIDLEIKKGEFEIKGNEDQITFILKETKSKYSEPGANIEVGELIVRTDENGKTYDVKLTLNYYNKYNIKYQGEDISKNLTKSSIPYSMSILSKENKEIDIEVN